MNNLKELIGQDVIAQVRNDTRKCSYAVACKVIDVNISDFYFQEKEEEIYITVNAVPIGKLPNGVDYEDLNGIPLNDIRRYHPHDMHIDAKNGLIQ